MTEIFLSNGEKLPLYKDIEWNPGYIKIGTPSYLDMDRILYCTTTYSVLDILDIKKDAKGKIKVNWDKALERLNGVEDLLKLPPIFSYCEDLVPAFKNPEFVFKKTPISTEIEVKYLYKDIDVVLAYNPIKVKNIRYNGKVYEIVGHEDNVIVVVEDKNSSKKDKNYSNRKLFDYDKHTINGIGFDTKTDELFSCIVFSLIIDYPKEQIGKYIETLKAFIKNGSINKDTIIIRDERKETK